VFGHSHKWSNLPSTHPVYTPGQLCPFLAKNIVTGVWMSSSDGSIYFGRWDIFIIVPQITRYVQGRTGVPGSEQKRNNRSRNFISVFFCVILHPFVVYCYVARFAQMNINLWLCKTIDVVRATKHKPTATRCPCPPICDLYQRLHSIKATRFHRFSAPSST
jgi:hypothetical protein